MNNKIILVQYRPDPKFVNGWWTNQISQRINPGIDWENSLFGIGQSTVEQGRVCSSWIAPDKHNFIVFSQHFLLHAWLREHQSLDLKQQAVALALRGCLGARVLSRFLETL